MIDSGEEQFRPLHLRNLSKIIRKLGNVKIVKHFSDMFKLIMGCALRRIKVCVKIDDELCLS